MEKPAYEFDKQEPLAEAGAVASEYAALHFDIEQYRKLLEANDMTEEQQDEFLSALWEVMVAFVDMGFNLSPIQHAMSKQTLDVDSIGVVPSEEISKMAKEVLAAMKASEKK